MLTSEIREALLDLGYTVRASPRGYRVYLHDKEILRAFEMESSWDTGPLKEAGNTNVTRGWKAALRHHQRGE